MNDLKHKWDLTVLVVEDDIPSRIYMSTLIKAKVKNVLTADNGRSGLELYIKEKPDIIISDVGMPFVNGLDMSRKIKELTPKAQIILTSTFDNKQNLLDALEIGVSQYIVKPVQKNSILAALQRVVDNVLLEKEFQKQYDHIQKLSKAIEQSPVMVAIMDEQGFVEYCNPTFYSVTGYSEEDIIGQEPRIFADIDEVYTDYQYYINNIINSKIKNFNWKSEFLGNTKNGEQIWLNAKISPVYTISDEAIHFVAILNDVTEQKTILQELQVARDNLELRVTQRTHELSQANEQLKLEIEKRKRYEKELIEAKEQAEAANKAKSAFLSKVSHELRTPMNGVLGIASILAGTELDEKQRKFLDMIKISGDNLLKIINDILDFSKIEAGKLKIINSKFNLKELIEQVVEIHKHISRTKGIDLLYNIEDNIPLVYYSDPGRIQQILMNLVSNAFKFTEKGFVKIDVILENIVNNIAELHFSVEDSGIGIQTEKINTLFKSFSQIDNSFTRKFGGTGLGLSISKELTDMLDGKIWVESVFKNGSTFHFTVKIEIYKEQYQQRSIDKIIKEQNVSEIARKYENEPLKILIAEDSYINQEVIKQALSLKDWKIAVANNGKEALNIINENDFDIILMDVQMPELDGLEVTKLIRNSEKITKNKNVPIIGITAHAFEEDKTKCFNAGMSAYISKPLDWDELFSTIINLSKGIKKNNTESQSPIDIGYLMNNLNNNKIVAERIIKHFVNYTIKEVESLFEAVSKNDFENTKKLSHKLKSEIANFGDIKSVELLKLIEDRAKVKDLSNLQNEIVLVNKEIIGIKNYLEKIDLNKI